MKTARRMTAGTALVLGAIGQGALGANTAVVLGGGDADPGIQTRINNVSGIAQQQYTGRGYTVSRVDNVTQLGFINSLCQANVTQLVFTGHGATGRGFFGAGRVWLGGGQTPDRYVSTDLIVQMVPLAKRQMVTRVVLNSCGQLRSGWAEAFPNARIAGWTGSVRAETAEQNQQQNGDARIATKGGRGDGPPGFDPLTMDPRIADAIPVVYHAGVDEFIGEGFGDFTAMPWKMTDAIEAAVGSKRFNFIVTDAPQDQVMLGGIEVSGGRATAQNLAGYAMPDFVVRFTHAAYEAAFADIDTIIGAFGAGQASIEANMTGVPGPLLFQGAVAVTFGLGAEPPCAGDADRSGDVGLGDVGVIITHWGLSGAPGQLGDLDGSGVRGLGDIAQVITNWGAVCP